MKNARALAAEAVGTAFLLAVVVGSGIMAERLAGGNVALALLAGLALPILFFTLQLSFQQRVSWEPGVYRTAVRTRYE